MAVITVLGEVEGSSLGITLAHEHLFIDVRNQFTEFSDPEKRRVSQEAVHLGNIGRLRRNPYAVRDNLLLDDLELCLEEVSRFKQFGGRTIVDCTSIGILRMPERLRTVAQRSGLNVVAGCGYYTQDTHAPEVARMSVEEIAEVMIRDLTEGIDGTDVRAGIIGEIGTSAPVRPDERKNILAAARAFRKVPAAIYVHTYPWGTHGAEMADLLIAQGVPPEKIVVCHTDVEPNLVYIRSLLQRGVCVEFDDFGKEYYIDRADRGFAGGMFVQDLERVRAVRQLVDWGYARQLLIATDVCLKALLIAYGGWGYSHILEHIVPMLEEEGVDREVIDTLLVANPARLLEI